MAVWKGIGKGSIRPLPLVIPSPDLKAIQKGEGVVDEKYLLIIYPGVVNKVNCGNKQQVTSL